MRFLHLEILGIQLLHIEWGRDTTDDEECRDTQYPMTIGFQAPAHMDEIHVRPELHSSGLLSRLGSGSGLL